MVKTVGLLRNVYNRGLKIKNMWLKYDKKKSVTLLQRSAE